MNRKRGFTLIELLLVMVIMGILLMIGTGAFISSLQKGRDTTRKANLRAIAGALELYYNDKSKYPIGTGSITTPGCYDINGVTGPCGKDFPLFKDSILNGAIYMTKFPVDPLSTQQYYYVSDINGKQYQIYAHLENNQDPQCLLADCASNGLMCGTVGCTYGVSSANTNP
jgi:prepilin-type N-terminal cleavage/methylation domain-containing protein